jgi:hypothetical protein
MDIRRKVELVWKLYAESQPPALGIVPLEELVRLEVKRLFVGDRCALVLIFAA